MFLGEESIDKKRVIITNHAITRFVERINELIKRPDYQSLIQEIKDCHNLHLLKKLYKKTGLTYNEIEDDSIISRKNLLKNLLIDSTHINAIGKANRVRALIDYGESYFFRNGRWQFRIIKNRKRFILATIVWLNNRDYSFCFS